MTNSRTTILAGIAALASAGALAACGTATNNQSAMPGMQMGAGHSSMPATHTDAGHAGAMSAMSGMSGMKELQPGADGTRASADGLTLTPTSSRTLSSTHLSPDGTFRITMTLPAPGTYRAIADFTTAGKRYALGTTLTAPGTASTAPLPAASRTATVDGYGVRIQHGTVRAGMATRLTFTVTRGGKPVTSLEPYLGAYGHLVALTERTLAYTHIHPDSETLSTGAIRFQAEFPTATTYRMFLQFRTGGIVRTAAFTIDAA
jgi:hypothetical protein